jgi:hypothetical protein
MKSDGEQHFRAVRERPIRDVRHAPTSGRFLWADRETIMTYIAEARVSGNHAAMGKSPPAASGGLFESSLTIWDILRAGVRRRAKRE